MNNKGYEGGAIHINYHSIAHIDNTDIEYNHAKEGKFQEFSKFKKKIKKIS